MEFTHFDNEGNAWMVDVGEKEDTKREAVAKGSIFLSPECFAKVAEGSMKKGDVLGVARVAGIMGAKKTSDLIPDNQEVPPHPIPYSSDYEVPDHFPLQFPYFHGIKWFPDLILRCCSH